MNGEFWDEKYKDSNYGYGEAPNAFLLSQQEYVEGLGNAFVPGDGEGRNGIWLASLGLALRSMDLSQIAVDHALEAAAKRDLIIDAWQGDLSEMVWVDGQWDCIAAIWLHLPEALRKQVHAGLWKSLTPGGIILIEAYRPAHVEYRKEYGSKGGPPTAIHMFSEEILREDFPEGEFELLEDADVVLDEGTGHYGRSATIQARIRKLV